jgi:ribose/xylose/arabinose/galactoside ABC-type transport system permease subunit
MSIDADPVQTANVAEGTTAADVDARRRVLTLIMNRALLLGVIALILFFALRSSQFLTVGNFKQILSQSSGTLVVAVPTAFLLIAGKVDLSIGSTLALGGVVAGLLMTHGAPPLVAAAAGVVSGAAVGVVNGVLTTRLRLSPIIVTLGMLTAVRGLTLQIAPDPVFGFPASFTSYGSGDFFGIPWLVLTAGAITAIGWTILSASPVGRHAFAIGVNEEAAFLTGIRVRRTALAFFVATGAAAGLAGVMLASQLDSAPSGTLGVGFELAVLTAVLLGGVAFDGGRGSIHGVVLGVLFLAILQNGLTILNAPTATASVVSGLALVAAAGLDRANAAVANIRRHL